MGPRGRSRSACYHGPRIGVQWQQLAAALRSSLSAHNPNVKICLPESMLIDASRLSTPFLEFFPSFILEPSFSVEIHYRWTVHSLQVRATLTVSWNGISTSCRQLQNSSGSLRSSEIPDAAGASKIQIALSPTICHSYCVREIIVCYKSLNFSKIPVKLTLQSVLAKL